MCVKCVCVRRGQGFSSIVDEQDLQCTQPLARRVFLCAPDNSKHGSTLFMSRAVHRTSFTIIGSQVCARLLCHTNGSREDPIAASNPRRPRPAHATSVFFPTSITSDGDLPGGAGHVSRAREKRARIRAVGD